MSAPPADAGRRAKRRHAVASDFACGLAFCAIAGWLTHGLWPDPATRALRLNPPDQVLLEWFLAFASRILHWDFALVTDRLNAPDGVNLLANASIIGLGVMFAPVTAAFGAPVTFALLVAGNLAGTAIAWYLLYARGLGLRRPAAFLGAALCGFSPAMVSQSNGHLHMTAQWLVPAIVWCVLRLVRAADRRHRAENGWRDLARPAVALAGLAALQVFIGEEVLLLTAFALLLVGVGWVLAQPEETWRVLPRLALGISLAAGLATVALAYPLRVQFWGSQHVPDGPFSASAFSADLASFYSYSPLSLGGTDALPYPDTGVRPRLTSGPAEYNAFFGLPLIALGAICLVWLRRQAVASALMFASFMMAWLSLGPQIVMNGRRTAIPGLYAVLQHLPLIDRALPTRFALAIAPLIATLLAVALHRAMTDPPLVPATKLRRRRAIPPSVVLGSMAALVPLIPTPLPVATRAAVPTFISEGLWRECVSPGGVLVPVPLPTPTEPDAMRWGTTARAEFALPEGFFIGPTGRGGRAAIGSYPRPSSSLLAMVAETGYIPPVGDAERAQFQDDLRYWGASCVAIAGSRHREELRATLDALLGPGRDVAGTGVWKTER